MGVHHHHHGHHHHSESEGQVPHHLESWVEGGGQSSSHLVTVFWLNFCFAIVELVGGWWINSFAILSDAVHDFGDALVIGLAWFLFRFSQGGRTARYTYGTGRISLVAALLAGFVVLAGSSGILVSAIPRLWEGGYAPPPGPMILLAFLGVSVNGWGAWKLSKVSGHTESMLTWHLLEDLLGWVAVLLGAVLIWITDWGWIDPLLALGVSAFIIWRVIGALWSTLEIFLQRSPVGIDESDLRAKLLAIEGVGSVHDLHLWTLDGRRSVLTIHLATPWPLERHGEIRKFIKESLPKSHQWHCTIQIEALAESPACKDDCEAH
jgi:cobalt-zinc-cadmium efflux system protein